MLATLLALTGSLIGAGAVVVLYLKWRGDLRRPWAVAGAWTAIAGSIALWTAAYTPDVGPPLAILVMTVVALGLVLKGADLRALTHFPSARPAPAQAAMRASWSAAAARALSAIIVAPGVGMTLGLLVWTWTPGHASTRFVCSVVVFLVAFAALQVWGLGAMRPWRALVLIALVGVTAAVPVTIGL